MRLILGDCLEKLKELPDNSVDSVVTDPPYGLGKEPNPRDVYQGWIDKGYHEITGKGFMGKERDAFVPQPIVWQEVLRVLKPGGYALVACGTRTQDWMCSSLRFSGFEVRDIVAWVYGSGFPKSLNIGKAVDKLQGNKRIPTGEIKHHAQKGVAIAEERGAIGGGAFGQPKDEEITKGNSPREGRGTALKPAMELRTLCRKPLSEKTVAKNVLKWGTGGINIDESRVDSEKIKINYTKLNERFANFNTENTIGDKYTSQHCQGRFPANIIHDGSEEVESQFPNTKSGGGNKNSKKSKVFFGNMKSTKEYDSDFKPNSGSASRYFKTCPYEEGEGSSIKYCAKASKKERNAGLDGFEEKQQDESRKEGNPGGDNPRNRGVNKTKNTNPCVKPISLMTYLCRLITPKGGTILDPYMGSGSTGIGAVKEGFDFIGIEMEEEYIEIAKARIEYIQKEKDKKLF